LSTGGAGQRWGRHRCADRWFSVSGDGGASYVGGLVGDGCRGGRGRRWIGGGAARQWWRCLGHKRRVSGGQGRRGGAINTKEGRAARGGCHTRKKRPSVGAEEETVWWKKRSGHRSRDKVTVCLSGQADYVLLSRVARQFIWRSKCSRSGAAPKIHTRI
jgi:hypothetical protein